MHAFWTAFIFIFMAEMGDKTQFMTLAMAAKYKGRIVLAGVTLGTMVISLVSVALGETVGKFLPVFWINLLAGVAFIIFGGLELKGEDAEAEAEAEESKAGADQVKEKFGRFGPVMTIATTFFVAELGDKTMLATVAIAGREGSFIGVWLGSTVGLVAANALAIFAGKALKQKLSAKTLRYCVAAVYIISGILAIVEAFRVKA
jgi:putative Ca2+/H+ antiporter (TMEM165/GDT1 family)